MIDNMSAALENKRKIFQTIARPFIAGLLAVFPLAFTVLILLWMADFMRGLLGPGSLAGRLLGSIGLNFATNETIAYLIGFGASCVLIYLFGLLVEAGLKNRWQNLMDKTMQRVPLVGTIYRTAQQLLAMFSSKDESNLKAMSPVICHFGGEGGAALLALMPSPEPIYLGDIAYHVVLIPTAPVPFGGGLFYVPASWVKPAQFAVDGLLNVYMSMGVSSTDYFNVKQIPPEIRQRKNP